MYTDIVDAPEALYRWGVFPRQSNGLREKLRHLALDGTVPAHNRLMVRASGLHLSARLVDATDGMSA